MSKLHCCANDKNAELSMASFDKNAELKEAENDKNAELNKARFDKNAKRLSQNPHLLDFECQGQSHVDWLVSLSRAATTPEKPAAATLPLGVHAGWFG